MGILLALRSVLCLLRVPPPQAPPPLPRVRTKAHLCCQKPPVCLLQLQPAGDVQARAAPCRTARENEQRSAPDALYGLLGACRAGGRAPLHVPGSATSRPPSTPQARALALPLSALRRYIGASQAAAVVPLADALFPTGLAPPAKLRGPCTACKNRDATSAAGLIRPPPALARAGSGLAS